MEEQNVQKKGAKRSFVGIVTSDKMDKTIVVSIDKKKMDRLYKKYVTRTPQCRCPDHRRDRLQDPSDRGRRWGTSL